MVKQLDMRSKALCSTIYMTFDNPKVGNSLKSRKLYGELKESVPIAARAKRCPLKKVKSTVIAERRQFLLYLAMQLLSTSLREVLWLTCKLILFTGKKTCNGNNYQQPISQGHFIPSFTMPKFMIRFYCWILKLKILK